MCRVKDLKGKSLISQPPIQNNHEIPEKYHEDTMKF